MSATTRTTNTVHSSTPSPDNLTNRHLSADSNSTVKKVGNLPNLFQLDGSSCPSNILQQLKEKEIVSIFKDETLNTLLSSDSQKRIYLPILSLFAICVAIKNEDVELLNKVKQQSNPAYFQASIETATHLSIKAAMSKDGKTNPILGLVHKALSKNEEERSKEGCRSLASMNRQFRVHICPSNMRFISDLFNSTKSIFKNLRIIEHTDTYFPNLQSDYSFIQHIINAFENPNTESYLLRVNGTKNFESPFFSISDIFTSLSELSTPVSPSIIPSSFTPMHLTIFGGKKKGLEILLNRDIRPSTFTNYDMLAFAIACYSLDPTEERKEIIEMILASPYFKITSQAFSLAITRGPTECFPSIISNVLATFKDSPTYIQELLESGLLRAIESGDVEKGEILLNNGANPVALVQKGVYPIDATLRLFPVNKPHSKSKSKDQSNQVSQPISSNNSSTTTRQKTSILPKEWETFINKLLNKITDTNEKSFFKNRLLNKAIQERMPKAIWGHLMTIAGKNFLTVKGPDLLKEALLLSRPWNIHSAVDIFKKEKIKLDSFTKLRATNGGLKASYLVFMNAFCSIRRQFSFKT